MQGCLLGPILVSLLIVLQKLHREFMKGEEGRAVAAPTPGRSSAGQQRAAAVPAPSPSPAPLRLVVASPAASTPQRPARGLAAASAGEANGSVSFGRVVRRRSGGSGSEGSDQAESSMRGPGLLIGPGMFGSLRSLDKMHDD